MKRITPIFLMFFCLVNSYGQKVKIGKTLSHSLGRQFYHLLDQDDNRLTPDFDGLRPCKDSTQFIAYNGREYGLINREGDTLIPFIYHHLDGGTQSIYRARINSKWGLLKSNGLKVLAIEFDQIPFYTKDFAQVMKNNRFGLTDYNRNIRLPFDFSDFIWVDSLVWTREVQHPKSWVLYNSNGQKVNENEFESITIQNNVNATIVKQNGLYGVVDSSGKLCVPCQYEQLYDFSTFGSSCFVKSLPNKSMRYGVINARNDTIIPPLYSKPIATGMEIMPVYSFVSMSNTGFYDHKGNMLMDTNHDIYYMSNFIVVKSRKGTMGAISYNGDTIIPFEYQYINQLDNGFILLSKVDYYLSKVNAPNTLLDTFQSFDQVGWGGFYFAKKNNSFGLLDKKTANWVVKPIYQSISGFDQTSLMKYSKNGMIGLLDINGVEIPNSYGFSGLTTLGDRHYIGIKEGKSAVLDNKFNELIPYTKNKIWPFNRDDILIRENGSFGVMDTNGIELLPFKYRRVMEFKQFVLVKKFGKLALFTQEYKPISQNKYRRIYDFQDTALVCKRNGKWVIVGFDGQEMSPFFKAIRRFDDRLFIAKEGRHWGLLDKRYNWVLKPDYDNIQHIESGFFVDSNNKWGMLDDEFDRVIPCIYDRLFQPIDGYIVFTRGGKRGLLNNKGNELQPAIYDQVLIMTDLNKGYIWVVKDNKYGLCNRSGNLITPIKYQGGGGFKDGFLMNAVLENGEVKYGVLDKDGKEIVPFIYNKMWWEGDFFHCENEDEHHLYKRNEETLKME